MKTRNLFLSALSLLVVISSCKKEDSSANDEIEATFVMSENQAVSEAAADDANTVFFEAAASEGLLARTSQLTETTGSLSCAAITVDPANSFPKTITIDFGTGCNSGDGMSRKGKIIIVLSNYLSIPGTNAVMSFDGYFVQGFKLEGTITWTNTSTPNGISWTRQIADGKVTAPLSGYYWLHTGTKTVVQTAGANTPLNLLDDVFSITGSHTITNPAGKTRSATITEALEKKATCHNITKGKIKLEGPNHFAIIDYGDGTCDNTATITIDGRPTRTIILP